MRLFLYYTYIEMDMVKVRMIRALYPYNPEDVVDMKKEVAERRESEWYLEIVGKEEKIPAKKNKSAEKKDWKSNK